MPFGLKNAAQAFQRLMVAYFAWFPLRLSTLTTYWWPAGTTRTTLTTCVRSCGQLVQKCLWSHRADLPWPLRQCQGYLTSAVYGSCCAWIPPPDSKANLQCFLGMINYYHRFMPQLAEKLYLLHKATRVKPSHGHQNVRLHSLLPSPPSPLPHSCTILTPWLWQTSRWMQAVSGQLEQFLSGLRVLAAYCFLFLQTLQGREEVQHLWPMEDALTETCARALICHWIARFGVPDSLTSDLGPQFTSHLCWPSLHPPPQHITLKQMGWWSAFIGSWKHRWAFHQGGVLWLPPCMAAVMTI